MTATARASDATDRWKATPGRVLLALVIVVLVWTAVEQAVAGAPEESPYSAYTRHDLKTVWPGSEAFPLAVPRDLPPGAKSMDGPGFTLTSVVVDPAASPSTRVWVSYYDSQVLGGGSSFRIFQRPTAATDALPCGPMRGVEHLRRTVSGGTVTICSDDLLRAEVRRYWARASLTSRLDDVDWLVDGDR